MFLLVIVVFSVFVWVAAYFIYTMIGNLFRPGNWTDRDWLNAPLTPREKQRRDLAALVKERKRELALLDAQIAGPSRRRA